MAGPQRAFEGPWGRLGGDFGVLGDPWGVLPWGVLGDLLGRRGGDQMAPSEASFRKQAALQTFRNDLSKSLNQGTRREILRATGP